MPASYYRFFSIILFFIKFPIIKIKYLKSKGVYNYGLWKIHISRIASISKRERC